MKLSLALLSLLSLVLSSYGFASTCSDFSGSWEGSCDMTLVSTDAFGQSSSQNLSYSYAWTIRQADCTSMDVETPLEDGSTEIETIVFGEETTEDGMTQVIDWADDAAQKVLTGTLSGSGSDQMSGGGTLFWTSEGTMNLQLTDPNTLVFDVEQSSESIFSQGPLSQSTTTESTQVCTFTRK